MSNNRTIESFSNRFYAEWNLIKNSKTNKGFIERIDARLVSFFRKDPATKQLTIDWDKQSFEEGQLLNCAYKELSDAEAEIRKRSDDPNALRCLEIILEEIRREGSCAFLKEAPYPYKLAYYKLHSLYVLKISKNWELPFAPSALKLIERGNADHIEAKLDTDPRYLWRQLVNLGGFWSFRHGIIYVGWPRVEGEGFELWIKADQVRREAFRKMVAAMLNHADEPNLDKDYFDREYFNELIERLFNEIILYLSTSISIEQSQFVDKENKGSQMHWRSAKHSANEEILKPIARNLWRQKIIEQGKDPKIITHSLIVALLKKYVGKNGILLQNPSDNLFAEVVKDNSPKIYKNGKFLGLDSNFY